MNLSDEERFAIAQAVYKAAAPQVKTKEPENLRGRLDAEIIDEYRKSGVKSKEIRVGGAKVGTLTLKVSEDVEVVDGHAFFSWAEQNDLMHYEIDIDAEMLTDDQATAIYEFAKSICPNCVELHRRIGQWPTQGLMRLGNQAVTEDGEVVPGVRWVDRPTSTVVRGCTPEEVSAALRQLPGWSGFADSLSMLPGGGGGE